RAAVPAGYSAALSTACGGRDGGISPYESVERCRRGAALVVDRRGGHRGALLSERHVELRPNGHRSRPHAAMVILGQPDSTVLEPGPQPSEFWAAESWRVAPRCKVTH